MRYNRDTESTARTVEELDAFKGHKPGADEPSDREVRIAKLLHYSCGLLPYRSSTFFNPSLNY